MNALETEILRNLSPRYGSAEWEIIDDAHTLPVARGERPLEPSKVEVDKALESLARGGQAIRKPDGWYRVSEPEPVEKQGTFF